MKSILTLTICFFSFFLSAQNNDKTILTISMYESIDKGYNKIQVHQNDKKIEEIQLSIFSYEDLGSHQAELNKILYKYKINEFKITSGVRGNITIKSVYTVMVTTYTLEK